MLARFRAHRGSLAKLAFLSARNDVLANAGIVAAGIVTAYLRGRRGLTLSWDLPLPPSMPAPLMTYGKAAHKEYRDARA
jgi:hypothetical protein